MSFSCCKICTPEGTCGRKNKEGLVFSRAILTRNHVLVVFVPPDQAHILFSILEQKVCWTGFINKTSVQYNTRQRLKPPPLSRNGLLYTVRSSNTDAQQMASMPRHPVYHVTMSPPTSQKPKIPKEDVKNSPANATPFKMESRTCRDSGMEWNVLLFLGDFSTAPVRQKKATTKEWIKRQD